MSTTKMARKFLAPGYKQDALAAATAVVQQPSTPTYAFSMAIEPLAWEVGHACGLSRTLIKKLRGRKAHEERGTDDERIDTEGALAEVLIAMLLDKAPSVTIAPLVAHKPDTGGVDITVDGKRLDVKSIGQAKVFINVNEPQHRDKAAAAYVLVHFARADIADVYVVGCETVATWKLNKFLRGAPLDPRRWYYSMKLPSGDMEALPVEVEAS